MKRTPHAVPAAIVALAMLAFLAIPTPAAPAGRIVIHGADSGSHLTLSVSGSDILVDGYMAHEQPVGCRFTRGRNAAVCPSAGAAAIEVDMGRRATRSKCSTACRSLSPPTSVRGRTS